MKLLVTGSGGQLGWELIRSLAPLGEVVATSRSELDLSRFNQIGSYLDEVRPDVIVNAAAYTAVDNAESEEALATCINGDAVGAMARWAASRNVLLVHYSTDYVFDGTSELPYRETDALNPLNAYGRSKLAGERALAESGADFLCLRTSWVYSSRGKNFLLTMLRLAQERERLNVVSDQIGAPTWARNLSDATALMVAQAQQRRQESNFQPGVYHLTASGSTSWHGFATAILERARQQGMDLKLGKLNAITSQEYPTPARRPRYSCLDGGKVHEDYGIRFPGWQSAANNCIDDALLYLHRA